MESACQMQRRKPLGEKIFGKIFGKLRGTLPYQAKKSSNYFWIRTTQKYDEFQKTQNTAGVTVLRFSKK